MIDKIENTRQALLYLTDCALITVGDMAQLEGKERKRRRYKYEYERHILVAQSGIDLLIKFNIEVREYTRIYEVLALSNRSVKEWAKTHQ